MNNNKLDKLCSEHIHDVKYEYDDHTYMVSFDPGYHHLINYYLDKKCVLPKNASSDVEESFDRLFGLYKKDCPDIDGKETVIVYSYIKTMDGNCHQVYNAMHELDGGVLFDKWYSYISIKKSKDGDVVVHTVPISFDSKGERVYYQNTVTYKYENGSILPISCTGGIVPFEGDSSPITMFGYYAAQDKYDYDHYNLYDFDGNKIFEDGFLNVEHEVLDDNRNYLAVSWSKYSDGNRYNPDPIYNDIHYFDLDTGRLYKMDYSKDPFFPSKGELVETYDHLA